MRTQSLIEAQAKYFKSGAGKYALLLQSARSRKIPICSKEEFLLWWKEKDETCFYCGIELKIGDGHIKRESLTIDRCDNKIGYLLENMVACCYRCNKMKSKYLTKDDMVKIGRIIKLRREPEYSI